MAGYLRPPLKTAAPNSAKFSAQISPLDHLERAGLKTLTLTEAQKSRLREAISDDIKKASNFLPHGVSEAARATAMKSGIDLCSFTWHQQNRFDKGRKTFVVEHFRPVSWLRDRCTEASSAADTLRILVNEVVVIWVLRSEDKELRRLGYRFKRPNPHKAYREANIVRRSRP